MEPFQGSHLPMQTLVSRFVARDSETSSYEQVRDEVRDILHDNSPANIPRFGPALIDISDLFYSLLPQESPFTTDHVACTACEYASERYLRGFTSPSIAYSAYMRYYLK